MSGDLIEWADEIVVMETRQARQLRQQFPAALKDKRIVNLNILDKYEFMQPELVAELEAKASRWI